MVLRHSGPPYGPAAVDESDAPPPVRMLLHPAAQALAFHMFTRCKAERAAFDECMDSADKSSKCSEQYQTLSACAKAL